MGQSVALSDRYVIAYENGQVVVVKVGRRGEYSGRLYFERPVKSVTSLPAPQTTTASEGPSGPTESTTRRRVP
jgi:hypothetical protein